MSDVNILGEIINMIGAKQMQEESFEHDMNKVLINNSLRNQGIDKQATLNQEATILADSLRGARDDINFARTDSANTANIMLNDSLNTANREDNQNFQRDSQVLGLTTGLIPTLNQIRNSELDDDLEVGDRRYGKIDQKMAMMKEDKMNARRYNPNVRKTRQALGQFFTESAWMGTDEGDIIEGYVNARDNHLEPMVMEVAKLPYNDPKRKKVIKLLNDMLDKRDNVDFQDGGYGPWDADPGGSQAKDIINEIKSFKTLLESDDDTILDEYYGVSPEEREFYDSWEATRAPIKKKKRDNTAEVINSLLEQIGKIGQ